MGFEMENIVWEKPYAKLVPSTMGIWPVPQFKIPFDKLKEVVAHCDRIQLVNAKSKTTSNVSLRHLINGGMPVPHLHFDNEIVLLDKPSLKKYFQLSII